MAPKDTKNPKDSEEGDPKTLSLNPSGTIWIPTEVRKDWGLVGTQGTLYWAREGGRFVLFPKSELRSYLDSQE